MKHVLLRKLGFPTAWLENTTLVERTGKRTRSCELSSAISIDLVPNRVGGMKLQVKDDHGNEAGCQLMIITDSGARTVGPEGLDQLVSALASCRAPQADRVRKLLGEQARYLETGAGEMGAPLRTHSERIASWTDRPGQDPPDPNSL